ncbi:MAG: aldehyde dehydrogenase family protein [Bacteroidia bacterium]
MQHLKIINPATEELIAEVEQDTPEIVGSIFRTLQEGQRRWAAEPLANRIACIETFGGLLGRHLNDLATLLSNETGKPLSQARAEIHTARGRIAYLVEHMPAWLGEEWVRHEPGIGEKIVYEPRGIVTQISNWNFPYLLIAQVAVPALLAGNAVICKASEYALLTGLRIEALLHEAGVPAQVFQQVSGGPAVARSILDLDIDALHFTGTYEAGREIYRAAARHMIPTVLQLGSKGALYVAAQNEDISSVVQAAIEGAFYNSGQCSTGVERIYVHRAVYEEFVEQFVRETRRLMVGNPLEEGIYIGPQRRPEQVARLRQMVGEAILQGAIVLTGERAWEGKGYYFIPTVLGDVDHNMRFMQEECFGPLIGIQEVLNDEAALRYMQDTPYGLVAAVFSDRWETAEPILRRLHVGTAYWNCCNRTEPGLPLAGRRQAGMGSVLDKEGFRAFMLHPKSYHLMGNV